MSRRGFALLAVLWVVTALSVLVLGATLVARDAVGAARNRVEHTRAAWLAEGCAEQTRNGIDRLLADGASWESLGATSRLGQLHAGGCTISLEPAGASVDVNKASEEQLVSLFRAAGLASSRSDSLASAVLDWRDPDDQPRSSGVESSWYFRQRLPPPRNGLFASQSEIVLVRGAASLPFRDSILGVEHGKIPINLAPLLVVASLPGIGPEIVMRLREGRAMNRPVRDLARLGDGISRAARDSLQARFSELVELATVDPDAWMLTCTARSGIPPVSATIELRLERAGGRAAVVRRRTW